MRTTPAILVPLTAAAVLWAWPVRSAESPFPVTAGPIKGFTVPAKEFLLKGESARPVGSNRFQLEGISIETRRGAGELNFILRTPGGEYDRNADLVRSTNTLDVQSIDGRFQLSGIGYDFQPRTNLLTIHSNVVTRFDRQFFARTNEAKAVLPDAGSTNRQLTVTSETFEFNGITGDAAYRETVHLTDGELLELQAGELRFNLASLTNETRRADARTDVRLRLQLEDGLATARADETTFSAAPGIDVQVEMQRQVRWTNNLLSGSAERLKWWMASNQYEFTAEAGTAVRFPHTLFATNHAGAPSADEPSQLWIDLESETQHFVPGRLTFDGRVKAHQDTNWLMATRRLVVDLDATNRPTRLEAIGDFEFVSNQPGQTGRGTAGHALVAYQPDRRPAVTLTESPRWVSPEFEKSADRIQVVDPLGEPVFSGDGNVRLELKGLRLVDLDWFGSQTNAVKSEPAPEATADPVLITAERSRYQGGQAVFSGNVLVRHGTNYLIATELALWFTTDRRLTNLVASGGVKVRQQGIVLTARELTARFDGSERNLPQVEAWGDVQLCGRAEQGQGRGIGGVLRYNGATGEAVLEDQPELVIFGLPASGERKEPPPYLLKAAQIFWNLRDETFRGRAPFSIINLPADADIPRACE
jgi:lipopolysaccharide export system protein LptA